MGDVPEFYSKICKPVQDKIAKDVEDIKVHLFNGLTDDITDIKDALRERKKIVFRWGLGLTSIVVAWIAANLLDKLIGIF